MVTPKTLCRRLTWSKDCSRHDSYSMMTEVWRARSGNRLSTTLHRRGWPSWPAATPNWADTLRAPVVGLSLLAPERSMEP